MKLTIKPMFDIPDVRGRIYPRDGETLSSPRFGDRISKVAVGMIPVLSAFEGASWQRVPMDVYTTPEIAEACEAGCLSLGGVEIEWKTAWRDKFAESMIGIVLTLGVAVDLLVKTNDQGPVEHGIQVTGRYVGPRLQEWF